MPPVLPPLSIPRFSTLSIQVSRRLPLNLPIPTRLSQNRPSRHLSRRPRTKTLPVRHIHPFAHEANGLVAGTDAPAIEMAFSLSAGVFATAVVFGAADEFLGVLRGFCDQGSGEGFEGAGSLGVGGGFGHCDGVEG